MPVAGGVADELGVEFLVGIVPRDRARYHVRAGAFAVQADLVDADGLLLTVGHQALTHHQPGVLCQFGFRGACRIVHAFDLHHLHLDGAAFFLVNLGHGVQDALALAVAGAVVLFHIADAGILAHEEAVDAVVLTVLVPAVVNAAPCDDGHIGVFADEKVVVYDLGQTAFRHDNRDVHALTPGARAYADFQPADVSLGDDFDIRGGLPSGGLAVGTDVVRAFGNLVQIGDFAKQAFLDLVKLQHCVYLPLPYLPGIQARPMMCRSARAGSHPSGPGRLPGRL